MGAPRTLRAVGRGGARPGSARGGLGGAAAPRRPLGDAAGSAPCWARLPLPSGLVGQLAALRPPARPLPGEPLTQAPPAWFQPFLCVRPAAPRRVQADPPEAAGVAPVLEDKKFAQLEQLLEQSKVYTQVGRCAKILGWQPLCGAVRCTAGAPPAGSKTWADSCCAVAPRGGAGPKGRGSDGAGRGGGERMWWGGVLPLPLPFLGPEGFCGRVGWVSR